MMTAPDPDPTGIDLTACDREPIHTPGAIQPHGVLLALEEASLRIVQVSANTAEQLGRPPEGLLGLDLLSLLEGEEDRRRLRAQLRALDVDYGNPLRLALRADGRGRAFDGVVHRVDGLVVLELEPARDGPDEERPGKPLEDQTRLPRRAILRMQAAEGLREQYEILVDEVSDCTGFDRVMVYQFDEDGHGRVVAERASPEMDPYLGLHYPASDIPQQARHLYTLNWLRLIADVDYRPAPLVPERSPATGLPLDLSWSVLRSVSPVHVQYLKNMGVSSSMSISLLKGDRLWGLIACHHRTPLHVPFRVRAACELLGCVMSLQLATREAGEEARQLSRLRAALGSMTVGLGEGRSPLDLAEEGDRLLGLFEAEGAVIRYGGESRQLGRTPPAEQVDRLIAWLRGRPDAEVFATHRLSAAFPQADQIAGEASGLISITLCRIRGDHLLFFRPEAIRTVHWGGDPSKAARVDGDQPDVLSPRTSFEAWKEVIRGSSTPWTPAQVEIARELRNSLVTLALARAERLAELNEELDRSNAELETLASAVARDLKERLGGIADHVDSIREQAGPTLGEQGHDRFDGLLRLVRRMDDLIDSLRRYSRSGRKDAAPAPTDLDRVLGEALGLLGARRLEAGGEVLVPRPLPAEPCDGACVREVLTNLIDNGLRYNDSPERRVEVGFRRPGEPGHPGGTATCYYVSDNGIGIPPRYFDRIFTMFVRLHGRDEYGGGTGAGLTVARKNLQRHGGRIWVESEAGRGSTFWFSLHLGGPG